ncbi:hypothetical protein [uncultured Lamprocystis sp.]|jgi:hypothetical protein|uniref:hypothetical protein n=2 Tax=uncultured Lamprocystis sp. TaxID=543132 RepID=UPI0025F83EF6|nr:hypothetical protein [uncultured Lamprocystis sp.]
MMSDIEVVIGEGSVTIRRSGRSAPIVAQVLALDRNPDGEVIRIWLDRLVHRPGEAWTGDWSVRGAVSSIVERVGIGPVGAFKRPPAAP